MPMPVDFKSWSDIAVLTEWRNSQFADFIKNGIEAGKKRNREIKSLLRN